MIALFAAALLLTPPSETTPDWQPHVMEGGTGWYDVNSVQDHGATRSIAFRLDVDGRTDGSYVTRIEVDCEARTMRPRAFAAYDRSGRQIADRQLEDQPFTEAGAAGPIVDAACSHPAPVIAGRN